MVVISFTSSDLVTLINKKKLEDGKDKLLLNEYSTLARDLSRPIMSLAPSPDIDFIEFEVEKFMADYPIVVL